MLELVDKLPRHETHMQAIKHQFDSWLKGIQHRLGVQELPSLPEQGKIVDFIDEANKVAEIVASEDYQAVLKEKQALAGDVKIGIIGCVDGRRKRNFPLGFIVSSTEVLAGEVESRKSNGREIPESDILKTALKRAVNDDSDLLQLVEAHTSLTTDHKCGAIELKKQKGEYRDATFEEAGLDIAQKSLAVVTDYYNTIRSERGFQPLQTSGVTILYDTDTMGYVLGYERGEAALSTTHLTKKYRGSIAQALETQVGPFGSMESTFTSVESVQPLAERTLAIEKYLLSESGEFYNEVKAYIDNNHDNLTERQKQGLRFVMATTVAHQYLTGLCDAVDNGNHPDHQFSPHNEDYISMSPDGKTFGGRHPGIQVFGTCPATIEEAVKALKIEISIREKTHKDFNGRLFHPVFITVAVDRTHLAENLSGDLTDRDNETVQRAESRLSGFLQGLYADPELQEGIKTGRIFIIPGLVGQKTRELLRIPAISTDI